MSEATQQENVIDYIQIKNTIHNDRPDNDVLDFLKCIIYLIIEDLEGTEGAWAEKWK